MIFKNSTKLEKAVIIFSILYGIQFFINIYLTLSGNSTNIIRLAFHSVITTFFIGVFISLLLTKKHERRLKMKNEIK